MMSFFCSHGAAAIQIPSLPQPLPATPRIFSNSFCFFAMQYNHTGSCHNDQYRDHDDTNGGIVLRQYLLGIRLRCSGHLSYSRDQIPLLFPASRAAFRRLHRQWLPSQSPIVQRYAPA